MVKTTTKQGGNQYHILKIIVIIAIILYILAIVPSYNKAVSSLFDEPVIKVMFLALIVAVGYMDSTIAVLLAIAFLVSMLSSTQYRSTPLGKAVTGVQSGARQVIDLPKEVLQTIPRYGNESDQKQEQKENMSGNSSEYTTPTAQQAFEMSERAGQQYQQGSANCTQNCPPNTGCDPVVGYNAPYDCICNENCTKDCDQKGRPCLCQGVATWEDELNAQGLNYPMGNPGDQVGATF